MSAKKRILDLLLNRVGHEVSREELMKAAGISEWGRRIRELSQAGYEIETTGNGYRLKSGKPSATTNRRTISGKQRYRILHRDQSICRRCGRSVSDGVKLVIDHMIPVDWGGKTVDDNLWTLCVECNSGKKAWESDADADAMKRVLKLRGAKNRLREYLRVKRGQVCTREELQIVAGISEYGRRIRELRAEGMNIETAHARGDYVHR